MAFTSVEGYPGRRFHAGVANIDAIEDLAIGRAKAIFRAAHANVQPHSGTQANQAVYFALLNPGDRVLSMELAAGGHLSHGLRTNLSGKWFNTVHYGTDADGFIDYDEIATQAKRHRPKLVIVGGSSYPRAIDFAKIAAIAKDIGAWLMADVAHFSGLVAAGCYPDPFPHVDIITTTTNKNLRGPRGGLILTRDEALGRRIDSAVFPGVQGGPLPEMITAKAVCFSEVLGSEFKSYAEAVLENARALAATLATRGYDIVTGGTDTPLVVVDLKRKGLTGARAQAALESAGLTCNRNLVPRDPEGPKVTSGIRIGTSAMTTRGMRSEQAVTIGHLIAEILDPLPIHVDGLPAVPAVLASTISELAAAFPIYPDGEVYDVS